MSKLKTFTRSLVNLPLAPVNMYRRSQVPRKLKETAFGTNASIKYPVEPNYVELWKSPKSYQYEVESTVDLRPPPPVPPPPPPPPTSRSGGSYALSTFPKNYKPGMSRRTGTGIHPLHR